MDGKDSFKITDSLPCSQQTATGPISSQMNQLHNHKPSCFSCISLSSFLRQGLSSGPSP